MGNNYYKAMKMTLYESPAYAVVVASSESETTATIWRVYFVVEIFHRLCVLALSVEI